MRPKGPGSGELNGFLGAGTRIQGNLQFDDTFRIEGDLNGKISSGGDLIVGAEGGVEGEVNVGKLFVSGRVRGLIHASERVEISASAHVDAEVNTPVLVVEEGAHFSGGCSMGPRTSSQKQEQPAMAEALP